MKVADFTLPNGIHSFVEAAHDGKWLFMTGRTNGMHTFESDQNNFPPSSQNLLIYVVDPKTKQVFTRALDDPNSGLSQEQIDSLSVTSAQGYQWKKRLYITGGYGIETSTGNYTTFDILTAVDVPGLMHWVMNPNKPGRAVDHIRQLHNPVFKVTGGYMNRSSGEPTLLIFGQDFEGYYLHGGDGDYTEQVRRFYIKDDGKKLGVKVLPSKPAEQDPNYRRRDLNVVPVIHRHRGKYHNDFVAYAGVFTPTTGVWTVPVTISGTGHPHMDNPDNPETFKQAMNQYVCAAIGLYSKETREMYTILAGGISFGFFDDGEFETDEEFPFINQITTIRRNNDNQDAQFLMANEYPTILSPGSNLGNTLLFGAGAAFMRSDDVESYEHDILKLDRIKEKTVIGHIVGGIQSTLPNTNVASDSSASQYIFEVSLIPKR
ncbi:MAG: hypothetical protein JSR46_12155 [Verrucomicrobia bacterium]|nr:hypothetical protein [Verrucomicrobiota bacterium]